MPHCTRCLSPDRPLQKGGERGRGKHENLNEFFVRSLESMLLRFSVSLRRRSAPSLVGFYSPARAFASAKRLGELLLSFGRLASANFYPPARALLRRTATLLRAPCFGVLLRDPCAPALFCCAHLLAAYCYAILVLQRFSAALIFWRRTAT